MPRVVHFEVYADDMDRASQVLRRRFSAGPWTSGRARAASSIGWSTPARNRPQGINGGMLQRPNPEAVTTIMLDVPSADEYSAKVIAGGGTMLVPKFAVPGVGYASLLQGHRGQYLWHF